MQAISTENNPDGQLVRVLDGYGRRIRNITFAPESVFMSRALMLVLRAIFVRRTVPFRCLNASPTRPFLDAHENDSQLWKMLRWLGILLDVRLSFG